VRVVCDFAVRNDGKIAAVGEELHDFGAFARELGPAGSCFGILFEGSVGQAIKFEVDLREASFGGMAHGIDFVTQGDFFGGVEKRLTPNGEEGFVERGGRN